MIENFTTRRMIIAIIGLGVLTLVVLILEERFTSDNRWSQAPTPTPRSQSSNGSVGSEKQVETEEDKSECWVNEDFKVVAGCVACTDFEIRSEHIPACKSTGFKETVDCNKSGPVFRSCTDSRTAQARFWTFEVLMLLLSILSYGYCRLRTSQLERATVKQIERRLASGM